MAALDDLLNIEGVVAAGEFGRDGSLVDYKARMDMLPEMAHGWSGVGSLVSPSKGKPCPQD